MKIPVVAQMTLGTCGQIQMMNLLFLLTGLIFHPLGHNSLFLKTMKQLIQSILDLTILFMVSPMLNVLLMPMVGLDLVLIIIRGIILLSQIHQPRDRRSLVSGTI